MKVCKSTFVWLAAMTLGLLSSPGDSPAPAIDRHALVSRHNVTWNDLKGTMPLGNGEFCFNADVTGLQTFGGNTMAHWAWHSFPLPPGITADQIPDTGTFQQGRPTGPDNFPKDKKGALRVDEGKSTRDQPRTTSPSLDGWSRYYSARGHGPIGHPRLVVRRAIFPLQTRRCAGQRQNLRRFIARRGRRTHRIASAHQRQT